MQEEIDQLNNYNDSFINDDKRPAFLTLLCILTFIGSGFAILGGLFNLMFSKFTESTLKLTSTMMENNPASEFISFDVEQMMIWQKYINISSLIGGLICLAGALLMWKQKKIGYFLYIPGAIIPAIVALIGMQYMFTGKLSGFSALGGYFTVLMSVVFIILYGINYKSLNK